MKRGPRIGISTANGAASGAAAGSAFGPWGALIGGGVGAVGGLFSGISSADEVDKQREEFLREEQRKAQIQALRHSAQLTQTDRNNPFAATYDVLDARERKRQVMRQLEDDEGFDPMALLPFVQNATMAAGNVYKDLKGAPAPKSVTGPRSGVTMTADEFNDLPGTYGPSSGARLSGDDFFDPEELQHYRGRW